SAVQGRCFTSPERGRSARSAGWGSISVACRKLRHLSPPWRTALAGRGRIAPAIRVRATRRLPRPRGRTLGLERARPAAELTTPNPPPYLSGTAQVAELVDALVSGTSAARRGGSSPLLGTNSYQHSDT